jgi:MFS family permease
VSAYVAFTSRNYRYLLAGTTLSQLANQMLGVVVGWDLYLATQSPVVLGNVGLVQVIPVFLFTFAAGSVADRYNRRGTIILMQAVVGVVGFALAAAGAHRGLTAIYTALFLAATARAFQWPANQALLPQTVPASLLTNAISWSGTGRELATVGGPAVGGVLLAAFGSESVYAVQAACSAIAVVCFAALNVPPPEPLAHDAGSGWRAALEGLRFVWREKLILSAMSLDLLAVFFGGAVALLPIFANDILRVGPSGLGWLRAAPAIGAGLMSFWLAHQASIRHGGLALLASVAMFGMATIGFGLATAAWLSFLMLFLTGVFDAVSVVLRISLVQTRTPDALRGRVAAVNGLFIASSNQWGAVESGLAAQWLGTVPSVVFGGTATILVVVAIGVMSRQLREWRHG